VDATEFLALAPAERERVLRQIALGRRSPMIEGLEAAVVERARSQAGFGDSVGAASPLGPYRMAQAAQLRRMTPEERLLRYRKGALTAYQGRVWEAEFPKEVPRVNGIPEWRARFDPEIADRRPG